jgi:phosphatidylserine/phosphatidylglycerophosphate/cardiolipin synthase-like enzyme
MSVNAIAGTSVVLFGIDLAEELIKGLRGFAILREDYTENDNGYLINFKRFRGQESKPGSDQNPIQEFVWGDYTAKENHKYAYTITAKYGSPGALTDGEKVLAEVVTENAAGSKHQIYFNRGVAASQAYATRFHNLPPDEVPGGAAFVWLSRGLKEAILSFLEEAKDESYALRAAMYEFNYPEVLHGYLGAKKRGVDVQIVMDAKENSQSNPRDLNLQAIKDEGISDLVIERTTNPGYIAHNKFVVLLHRGDPVAVWTGSTNISEGGIFGHSNVGHLVRDPKIATAYLGYWNQLKDDPEAKKLRPWDEGNSKIPGAPAPSMTPVFSPRSSLEALQFYAETMDKAKTSVFFTAAFGVNDVLKKVLETKKAYLRYVLLEKIDDDLTILMKRDTDDRFAVGSLIDTNALERWVREKLTGLNTHVRYIHTKFMVIDPLSPSPTVITGSANFSDNSTTSNDENMLIIRGDTDVADIYLTEFMRLFVHYEFRQHLMKVSNQFDVEHDAGTSRSAKGFNSYLDETDKWSSRFFVRDSPRAKERLLFNGQ